MALLGAVPEYLVGQVVAVVRERLAALVRQDKVILGVVVLALRAVLVAAALVALGLLVQLLMAARAALGLFLIFLAHPFNMLVVAAVDQLHTTVDQRLH